MVSISAAHVRPRNLCENVPLRRTSMTIPSASAENAAVMWIRTGMETAAAIAYSARQRWHAVFARRRRCASAEATKRRFPAANGSSAARREGHDATSPAMLGRWKRRSANSLGSSRRVLERGEPAVDQMRDRQQLRSIEIARKRIAATVVDPVENAYAIFQRIAESGFFRMFAVPAHEKRDALLVGVFVHEQRAGPFVAGDQPSTDQREADIA